MLFGIFFAAIGFAGSILLMVAFGIFFLLIGIPLEYAGIKQGGTLFYLTNFRLVRAKKGAILNQVSRQVFRGKSLSSFLNVTSMPRDAKDRAWQKIENFHVDVLDPNSGSSLMSLGWIPGPAVQTLEAISQEVYCQYCGRKNLPSSAVCSECGADL